MAILRQPQHYICYSADESQFEHRIGLEDGVRNSIPLGPKTSPVPPKVIVYYTVAPTNKLGYHGLESQNIEGFTLHRLIVNKIV